MRAVMKFGFLLWIIAHSALSQAATYQMQQGLVEFAALGKPAFIKINGRGQGLSGAVTESESTLSGVIEFQLDTLNTGIDLRDEHMKKRYMQTHLYPKAVLRLMGLNLPADLEKPFPFQGRLELRDVIKGIEGLARVKAEGDLHRIEAEFSIKISEFGIDVPSFQGITVTEDVKIKVHAQARRSP